jgi:hypothetical protein
VDLYKEAAELENETADMTTKLSETTIIAEGCKTIIDIKLTIKRVKKLLTRAQDAFGSAISACSGTNAEKAKEHPALIVSKKENLENHHSKIFELDHKLCE